MRTTLGTIDGKAANGSNHAAEVHDVVIGRHSMPGQWTKKRNKTKKKETKKKIKKENKKEKVVVLL